MTKQEPKKDDPMHEEGEEREDKEVNPDALDAVLGEGEGFGEEHEHTHPPAEPREEDAWRDEAPEMQNFDDEQSW